MVSANYFIKAAGKYNNSTDMLKSVYGISSDEIFDAIIVAPSWTPYKVYKENSAQIEVIRETAGYESYIVEIDGLRLGWLRCGMSSSNVIDAMLASANSRTDKMIFLGAVGALKADIEIGEFCTPSESYAYDGASLYLYDKLDTANFGSTVRPGCAEYIEKVLESAAKSGIKICSRPTFCTDSIICEYAHLDEIKATGAELIEMETAAFYRCLELMGKKGIALLSVSDNSASGMPLVARTPEQKAKMNSCRTVQIPEVIKLACEC